MKPVGHPRHFGSGTSRVADRMVGSRSAPSPSWYPLALVALVATLACSSGRAVPTNGATEPAGVLAEACVPGQSWSVPRRVTDAANRPVYVEQPMAFSTPEGIVLLGEPTWVWDTPYTFLPPPPGPGELPRLERHGGILIGNDGSVTTIPLPPRPERPVQVRDVRAVPDGEGGADVLWLELPPRGSPDGVAELWHARFERRAWSQPRRVLTAPRLRDGPGGLAIAGRGRNLHVAVLATDRSVGRGGGGVLQARTRPDGRWESWWAPSISTEPWHVALATAGEQELVMAFVGTHADSATGEGRRIHGLYAARSGDAGATWSEPRLLRALDGNSGHLLDATSSDAGDVHLTWIALPQAITAGAPDSTSRLQHHYRPRDGEWEALPDRLLPGQPINSRTVVDERGGAPLARPAVALRADADELVAWRQEGRRQLLPVARRAADGLRDGCGAGEPLPRRSGYAPRGLGRARPG